MNEIVRQRFSIIPAMAVTDQRLEPRDLQVLCLLGRHTDDLGWCCRSQVKMAKELNCGRATVQRALGRLVEAGYLEHRPKQRASGADSAHDYRVVIDPPEAPAKAESSAETTPENDAENPSGGVPTGGQGCPPMDGQGVPTHERAPMLTTPVKRSERARASGREDSHPQEAEPGRKERQAAERDFKVAFAAWPTFKVDSEPEARREWARLTRDEQVAALDREAEYVAAWKASGRKTGVAFSTYLAERRWERLGPKREEAPAPEIAAPFGKAFMAKRLAALLAGPTFTAFRLTSFEEAQLREGKAERDALLMAKQAGAGFPGVADMDRQRATTVAPGIAGLGADFTQARKGDERYEAWRAGHAARGWPWIPDWVEWVWLPPGAPDEALREFEEALARMEAGEASQEAAE